MSDLLRQLFTDGSIGTGLLETVYLTLISTAFAYLLGLPLGLLLYVTDRGGLKPCLPLNKTIGIVVNLLRSIPFVILMVAFLPVAKAIVGTSLGNKAMIVMLIVAAAPFVARMVESSAKEVKGGVIEAAKSMGASNMQILFKVILPEAKPALIVGAIITTVNVIGYSAMAGTIGGGGLGAIAITYGYQRFKDDVIWVCVALMVILVQVLQEVGMFVARRTDKRVRSGHRRKTVAEEPKP